MTNKSFASCFFFFLSRKCGNANTAVETHRLWPILPYALSRKLLAQFWFQSLYCAIQWTRHSLICKGWAEPVVGSTGKKNYFEPLYCHWRNIFINCQAYGLCWYVFTKYSETLSICVSLWILPIFRELAISILGTPLNKIIHFFQIFLTLGQNLYL